MYPAKMVYKSIIFSVLILFIFSSISVGSGSESEEEKGDKVKEDEIEETVTEKVKAAISINDEYIELTVERDQEIVNDNSDADLKLEPGRYKITTNNSDLKVLDSNEESIGTFTGPLFLKSAPSSDAIFTINNAENGEQYRGELKILNDSNGEILAVNIVDVESYLRGVLPKEMPAFWSDQGGTEALKAQAIAARSYTFYNIRQNPHNDYHLCDTVQSQVYGGVASEHPDTDRAVRVTEGIVLKYGGEIISPFYHATNAGFTELPQNVWDVDLPYYESVPDPYDDPGHSKNTVTHGHALWELDIPAQDVAALLLQSGYKDIGEVQQISVRSTFKSGRVDELYIEGATSNEILRKEDARNVFELKSQLFDIKDDTYDRVWVASSFNGDEKKQSITSLEGKWVVNGYQDKKELSGDQFSAQGSEKRASVPHKVFVFEGRGFGHGIGMSQNGAYNRAKAGYDYKEILSFYYPGADVSLLQ